MRESSGEPVASSSKVTLKRKRSIEVSIFLLYFDSFLLTCTFSRMTVPVSTVLVRRTMKADPTARKTTTIGAGAALDSTWNVWFVSPPDGLLGLVFRVSLQR